jgi:hypothetical protein
MPDPYERHARGPDDWGRNPGRRSARSAAAADQLADPAPAKVPPRPKNTRVDCGGHRGREHQPAITHDGHSGWSGTCQWIPKWNRDTGTHGIEWNCAHRERCDRCQKILREGWQLAPAECPAYPGTLTQQEEATVKAAEWAARPRYTRTRPVIDGPTGYRRPKAGGQ